MTVSEMIKERNLPPLRSREEMVEILQREEYGFIRDIPYRVTVSPPRVIENHYLADTVEYSIVEFTVTTRYGSHTIPVRRILHTDGSVNPFFVFLNFRNNVPDKSYPLEEVAANGFDVLLIKHEDITSDNDDFTNGLPRIFIPCGRERDDDGGKIAYWAWFTSRVLDYAQTIPCLNMKQAAVMGGSRLGKTALVAGMLDTRFRYAFSVVSGCGGAALARGNSGNAPQENYTPENIFDGERNMSLGETIRFMVKYQPFFTCRNYQKYIYTNIPEDFDQHYLVASIAPRFAYISSAVKDHWADPPSEFLCGAAASEAYEKMGCKGLVHDEKMPEPGSHSHEGRIGHHLTRGSHCLCRQDWLEYMAFIRKHENDEL